MFNLIKIYSLGIGATGIKAIIIKIIKTIKYTYTTRRDRIILSVIKYRYSLFTFISYIIILIIRI